MAYPPAYYVIPEHHIRLSDDRTELVFDQHLPNVSKDDLSVEVLEESICLDFRAAGKEMVSRCFPLPYAVDPSTAVGEYRDNVLTVRAKLRDTLSPGAKLAL